jgi:hypothetical protein
MSLTSSMLLEILVGRAFTVCGSGCQSTFFQIRLALFVRVVLGIGSPLRLVCLGLAASGVVQN